MLSNYARKVDQQLLYAQQLLDLSQQASSVSQAALIQAIYAQVEFAARCYLLELCAAAEVKNIHIEYLTRAVFENAADLGKSSELQELNQLAQKNQDDNWLSNFLNQLLLLRQASSGKGLQAAIFQQEVESESAQGLITAKDVDNSVVPANRADVNLVLAEFHSLVKRQRAVNEEF